MAGNGTQGYSGDKNPATAAELNTPNGVAVDSQGDLFIADTVNNVIREVNHATGNITTVAGNGTAGYGGDNGPGTSAELNAPVSVAVDNQGDLFIADTGNNVIREVNATTGVITTVAGNGFGAGLGFNHGGFTNGNGVATSAELNSPYGVAVGPGGSILYIADTGNNVIRLVFPSSNFIGTVAGDGFGAGLGLGHGGYTGDNGSAGLAELNSPTGVAVDSQFDIFIADNFNNVIREVNNSTDIITTVAGDASGAGSVPNHGGYTGDAGPATSAELNNPYGVTVDNQGNLFIADSNNNVIREVNPVTGNITTVAGNGAKGYAGDTGPATSAELNNPQGVAVDSLGNLYIADTNNNVIRQVVLPYISNVAAASGTLADGGSTTITWTNNNGFTGNVDLVLSTDGGATFPITIATNLANTGSFSWTVPPGVSSTNAEIRVQATGSDNPHEASLPFVINAVPTGPGGPIATDTPLFTWTANPLALPQSSGATEYGYQLFVADQAAPGTAVLFIQNITENHYQVSAAQALIPGHAYNWFIGAVVSSSGAINWSQRPNFVIAPLSLPTQIGPSGTLAPSTGFDTPTFSWTNVTDASHYYLYVLDKTTGQPLINNSNVSGTSFSLSEPLTPGDSYAWYIGAEGAAGANGPIAFSGPQNFSLTALAQPTQDGPSGTFILKNGAQKVTFIWNQVAGASDYYVYVLDSTTNKTVVDVPFNLGTSLTPTTLLTSGHSYTWYVGAVSTNQIAISWSDQTFSLATGTPPAFGQATQSGPSGTIQPSMGFDTPTFSWSSVTNAVRYYLYVFDSTANQAVISNPAIFSTYFTGTALTPGHSYTWYIGAVFGSGAITWSSETFALAATPSAVTQPVQMGTTGTIASNGGFATPTFSWSSVTNAVHYYLYVLDTTTNQAVVNNSNLDATSFVSTPLTAGDSFIWYVGAVSGTVAIAWSSETFAVAATPPTTLAQPTQMAPTGTIPASAGYDLPTFSWTSVTGAAHYYFYILDNTTNKVVVTNPSVSGISFTLSTAQALTPGHNYTWFVGAAPAKGAIEWSSETFALAALPAPIQIGLNGSYSASIISTTPTFSWSGVTGAVHYYLYLVDDTTNQVVINNASISATSLVSTKTLTVGHTYTWYIAAESTNNTAFFSGPDSFTLTP